MKKFFTIIILLVFIPAAIAQYTCPVCTETVNTNNATVNATVGIDVICITASVTNTTLNNLNTGDIICVSPGVTWTMPANLNFNGLVTFRIGEGAIVTLPGTGSNGNLQIDNWGTLQLTNTNGVNFIANGGSVMLINNYVGGIVDGAQIANVTFGNGSDFFNQGTMNFVNLELAEAASPYNDASGVINIKRTIYIHSMGFDDYGFINTTCEDTGNPAWNLFWLAQAINGCGLTVGDKGPNSVLFGPNSCTVIEGVTVIGGPVMINGYYEVSGDFTVNKLVSGTGNIVVANGVSRTQGDGVLTGGVNFYDVNTALGFGNNFGDGTIFPNGLDFNNGNPQDNFVIPATQPSNPCLAGPVCSISTSGLSALLCNNATTPMSPADDFITFSLNPTGTDLAATYNVSVSSGTITPTNASYGVATNFQLQAGSAGGGNVMVTITDATDATCQLIVNIVDPGSCSAVMPGTFDLALTKAISSLPSPAIVGSSITYTLTIINQGNVNATNIAISDFIPTGLTLNDLYWTAAGNVATLNTPIASLSAMSQTTVDITFTINNQATGSIINTAEISSAIGGTDTDSNPGNGTAGSSEDDISSVSFAVLLCTAPVLTVQNDTICKGTSINLNSLVISHTGDELEFYTSLIDAQNGTNELPSPSVTPTSATSYYIKSVFNPAQMGCDAVKRATVYLKSANCVGIGVSGPQN
ncbi:MAG: DUF11 domain-containing protein [Saprospiraceae bacterium]|nr:DUF11 domain-containing protein [Saprospiraceae bacterium]